MLKAYAVALMLTTTPAPAAQDGAKNQEKPKAVSTESTKAVRLCRKHCTISF